MNTVLYTRDMEPITVIDLPLWALEYGERRGSMWLEVLDAPKSLDHTDRIESVRCHAVRLDFHRLRMPGDRQSWLVTVDNDEAALLLKPSWLPGQRGDILQYERRIRALSEGMLAILSRGVGGH